MEREEVIFSRTDNPYTLLRSLPYLLYLPYPDENSLFKLSRMDQKKKERFVFWDFCFYCSWAVWL